MDSTQIKVPESVTFEQALNITSSLLAQMEEGKLEQAEIQKSIESLAKTPDGARGFLGSYLKDDRTLADNPSEVVVNALKSHPEVVGEFLVKSFTMSVGMAITHRRNNDESMAQSSERVTKRATILFDRTKLDPVPEKLKKMRETIVTGEGEYQEFIKRWGYDEEQKQAMEKALSEIIK